MNIQSATDTTATTATTRDRDDSVITLPGLGLNVALPVAAYYGLRLIGVRPLVALLAIAVVSSISTVTQIIQARRLVSMNTIFLLFTVVGIGQSLIHGNPRFLLMVDALISGTAGIGFMATAASERPFGFTIARAMLERRFRLTHESWADLWDRVPRFRHIWRVSTVVWGIGTIVDALIRITMALTLPVDAVPGLSQAVLIATFVVLQVATNIYYHRAGLWRILLAEREGSDPYSVAATWR